MFTNNENAGRSILGQSTGSQLNQSTSSTARPSSDDRAVIIGLYGVPGSGKTFLLDQLKRELGEEHFAFYEGSKMIATLCPGGLDAFKRLEVHEQTLWRQRAIDAIGKDCVNSKHVAVVAGHFMFWPEGHNAGQPVCTQNDLDTYTHVLYLDVPAGVVEKRRRDDTKRDRPSASANHIRRWQQTEIINLRHLCRQHAIVFSLVSPHPSLLRKVSMLLHDFRQHTEKYNLSRAMTRVDELVDTCPDRLETVLVIDADRTLAAEDTGMLFWDKISKDHSSKEDEYPLKTLFNSSLGYSYVAFRQAVLLYEETADDREFDTLCREVASAVTLRPEFLSLLHAVAKREHVGAVVVSCGIRRIWDLVLEREGLSKTARVIGGGRVADGFVVTAAVKSAVVARLQDAHGKYVWSFGDSPLDVAMLAKADQAIIVVGDEQTRSKTMDAALRDAIENHGLRARQAVLPCNAPPRLDTTTLPLVQLTNHDFVDSVFCRRRPQAVQVLHATERAAAKLLKTPTRDATFAGPCLREAHRRVGWYLATEFLGEVIGVEEYSIQHVQGHCTTGYRLLHEPRTSIVALMRAGEAMALGINDVFPLAMFVHASHASDVMFHHLRGQSTVVLVDAVVNSGRTMVQFMRHIRELHATIRIVVVTGVAQAQSVSEGGLLQKLVDHAGITLVALRLSDNKFTGSGVTDTGNRLFNTTRLP